MMRGVAGKPPVGMCHLNHIPCAHPGHTPFENDLTTDSQMGVSRVFNSLVAAEPEGSTEMRCRQNRSG